MPSWMEMSQIPRSVSSAWTRTPSSKLRLKRARLQTTTGVAGLQALGQLTPARAVEGRAGGVVDVDELAADAVLLQLVELRLDVAVVAVSLADPRVPVNNGDHAVNLVQGPLCIQKETGVFNRMMFVSVLAGHHPLGRASPCVSVVVPAGIPECDNPRLFHFAGEVTTTLARGKS